MRRGPHASRFLVATFLPALVSCAAWNGDRPALPPTVGELAIEVRYPPAGSAVTATDSTFVFGAVLGASGVPTSVTVNGVAAEVDPGGGWLAFVPLDPDSFTFVVEATAGGRDALARRTVWVPRPLFAPASDTLPYKPDTIEPRGPLEVYAGDTLRVSVVAAPGLTVRVRLGDEPTTLLPGPAWQVNRGRQVWGSEEPVEGATPAVLERAAAAAVGPAGGPWVRYAGDLYVRLGGQLEDTLALEIEAAGDSLLVVPVAPVTYLDPTVVRVAILDDDSLGVGGTDGRVVARTGPGLGYQALLLNGTSVATARRAGGWREIALGPGTRAWVPIGEAFPIRAPAPRDVVAVVRTRVVDGWSEVVLPLAEPLPFRVEQRLDPLGYTIDVYGLVSNVDWIETSIEDPLIESVRWSQPADRVFRLEVDLGGERAWGWRSYREGTHLVVGFRHSPEALANGRFRSPLHGLRVVVDPGHSPDPGAIGPTGLTEADANLEVSLELARILEDRGAQVVLTRATPDSGLGLYERTHLAAEADGDLFVSIHNNALPDGVNPFRHNGTSVLWYHPQSEPLARAIQAELLRRTGLPDHGVWYQNLAVTRMTEMPAVLVEAAFMMIPGQEALLRTPAYRRAIAEGVAAGIAHFVREKP
ncbi:MAG: N-acetylmuramoyl-L-alanine amidase family protein [Gemmatimonadota bacterium]